MDGERPNGDSSSSQKKEKKEKKERMPKYCIFCTTSVLDLHSNKIYRASSTCKCTGSGLNVVNCSNCNIIWNILKDHQQITSKKMQTGENESRDFFFFSFCPLFHDYRLLNPSLETQD